MIVDTSALLAIAWNEPERARFEDAIEADPVPPMPAADISGQCGCARQCRDRMTGRKRVPDTSLDK
jgi:uncharacterized protein with PIN domain